MKGPDRRQARPLQGRPTCASHAGLTQAEPARRIGTTQSSIARMEGSGNVPTVDMLVRIARATAATPPLLAPGTADVEITAAI
jgi:transcriptional regulator with XRE-family HTH domain